MPLEASHLSHVLQQRLIPNTCSVSRSNCTALTCSSRSMSFRDSVASGLLVCRDVRRQLKMSPTCGHWEQQNVVLCPACKAVVHPKYHRQAAERYGNRPGLRAARQDTRLQRLQPTILLEASETKLQKKLVGIPLSTTNLGQPNNTQ